MHNGAELIVFFVASVTTSFSSSDTSGPDRAWLRISWQKDKISNQSVGMRSCYDKSGKHQWNILWHTLVSIVSEIQIATKFKKKIQFLVQIIICGSSLPCESNFKIIKSMLTIFPKLLCWRQRHIMDEILKNALSNDKCLLIPGSKNILSQIHKVVMLYVPMFKFSHVFRRVRVLKRLSWYTRLLEKLTELNRS